MCPITMWIYYLLAFNERIKNTFPSPSFHHDTGQYGSHFYIIVVSYTINLTTQRQVQKTKTNDGKNNIAHCTTLHYTTNVQLLRRHKTHTHTRSIDRSLSSFNFSKYKHYHKVVENWNHLLLKKNHKITHYKATKYYHYGRTTKDIRNFIKCS
jgi:hypothetical protein